MSEQRRLHIPHGTYYAVQFGSPRQPLFTKPADYAQLELLLASALARTRTRALAYCWLPHSIHLAVQIESVPLGRFLQGFTSRYARYVHDATTLTGHLFAHRYRAVLLDPSQWLLPLIRYLHWLPQLRHDAAAIGDPHTSHAAYLRERKVPWLDLRIATALMAQRGDPRGVYLDLMAQSPTPAEIRLFTLGNKDDARIIGDADFKSTLPRAAREVTPRTSLEDIILRVSTALGVERAHLLSRSRRHTLVLARAVIAWHATERGIATLTEVARRLRRHPSSLSSAIERYRGERPDLFALNALHHLVPLA